MSNIKNFVDEKTNKKIVDALCALDFNTIHKLAKDSGVPVHRLQSFVDGDEKITQIDKGKLIVYLVKLVDMSEKVVKPEVVKPEETKEHIYTTLKEFQQRNAG